MTLSDLAERIGVTKGFLSDVERDNSSPSVASLVQICKALNLPIGDLFPDNESSVIRRNARVPIKFGGYRIQDYLINPSRNSRFQAIISYMEPGGGGGEQLYSVDTDEEFVFVLKGRVRIRLESEMIVLNEGDSMTFSPRLMHTFENASDSEPANAIFIFTPSLPGVVPGSPATTRGKPKQTSARKRR